MIASFLLIIVINTIYFFNKSLISAKSSSCVGPFGASGAGAAASFFLNLFIPFTSIKRTNATHTKLITAAKNFPYATPLKASSSKFLAPVASKAGVSNYGVITSATNEETIEPKAPPIITPIAKSRTFPLTAKSLNSFKNPIIFSLKFRAQK